MELVIFLLFIVVIVLIALIPSWVLLLVYDYLATQLGWATLEVTFLNVLCIAVIISILSSIFKKN